MGNWKGEKWITKDRFQVLSIGYNEKREITDLQIQNQQGKLVYSYCTGKKAEVKPARSRNSNDASTDVKHQLAAKALQERMDELQRELDRTGVSWQTVLKRYGLYTIDQMTEEQYRDAMAGLRKSRSVA